MNQPIVNPYESPNPVTEDIAGWPFTFAKLFIYIVWGMALGKRSRDLGSTFTYGMIVGCLFRIIGIIFLSQDGKKYKAHVARRQPSH